ncbi:hypothetical protein Slin15195_G114680 [Septoria linicola]|uniref:Uncharacterized protein n=1 Tax=Septoria linicola TaxID=215465 RepID=A0A9Q9AZN0_9PEZI|nr:hypothetical protein Slin14017_G122660 [Septoria linicola]USW58149.1 hypothetical protein Slin15195_G114680 [Septoria linicola]
MDHQDFHDDVHTLGDQDSDHGEVLDAASSQRAEYWEDFEQVPRATVAEELESRRAALASLQEPVGKWEGDDYRPFGWSNEEPASEMLTRLAHEYRQDATNEQYDAVGVTRMHGRTYMGDDDLSDNDNAFSETDHELDFQAMASDNFESYDEDGQVRFDDSGEVFVHTRAPHGLHIVETSDQERLVNPTLMEQPDPVTLPLGLQVAHDEVFPNERELDLMTAFEYLQEHAATLPEDRAQGLANVARDYAHDYLRYPDAPEFNFFTAARHQGSEISPIEDRKAADLDEIWDGINTDQAEFDVIEAQIVYWTNFYRLGLAIWNRGSPQDAAVFKKFAQDVKISLENNLANAPGLDFTVLCWGIGVIPNLPDPIVQAIRRLARLHSKRVELGHDIRTRRRRALFMEDPLQENQKWIDTEWHRAELALYSSQDLELLLQTDRGAARIGYESWDNHTVETFRPLFAFPEHLPVFMPFSRKLETVDKRLAVRLTRLAQAEIRPMEVSDIAGTSHATLPHDLFLWIGGTLALLSAYGESNALDAADLSAKFERSETLLDIASKLEFPERAAMFTRMVDDCKKAGLVPQDYLDGYFEECRRLCEILAEPEAPHSPASETSNVVPDSPRTPRRAPPVFPPPINLLLPQRSVVPEPERPRSPRSPPVPRTPRTPVTPRRSQTDTTPSSPKSVSSSPSPSHSGAFEDDDAVDEQVPLGSTPLDGVMAQFWSS